MHFIEQVFGEGCNLYKDVLLINSDNVTTITKADLRKAYYRTALKYHPDKNPSNQAESARKFQAITSAYQLLQNDDFRTEYNRTNKLPSTNDDYGDDDFDANNNKAGVDMWKDYFSSIFGTITVTKIDEFAAKYKCSEEECRDVIKEFKARKGNLLKMIQCVILSEPIDAKRWVEDFILPATENDPSLKKYLSTMNQTLKQIEKQIEKDKNKRSKQTIEEEEEDYEDASSQEEEAEDEDEMDEDEEETESDDSHAKRVPKTVAKVATPTSRSKNAKVSGKSKEKSPKKGKPLDVKRSSSSKKSASKFSNNNNNNMTDLIAQIQQRNTQRGGGGFSSFAARYGIPEDETDPISNDVEFAKIQSNLMKNKENAGVGSGKKSKQKSSRK